jgi:hypothetical protein
MSINIPNASLIACMCEGGAESAIIDMLLDSDLLIFSREQLIDESVIKRLSAKNFEKRYLRTEYDQEIVILRVIDSRREGFNLSKCYRRQVSLIDVITAPEIEILIIVSQKKYNDFYNSKINKPSEYCKTVLGLGNVKSEQFIKKYFHDVDFLVKSIKEYNRVHRKKKNEYTIFDLLKQ